MMGSAGGSTVKVTSGLPSVGHAGPTSSGYSFPQYMHFFIRKKGSPIAFFVSHFGSVPSFMGLQGAVGAKLRSHCRSSKCPGVTAHSALERQSNSHLLGVTHDGDCTKSFRLCFNGENEPCYG